MMSQDSLSREFLQARIAQDFISIESSLPRNVAEEIDSLAQEGEVESAHDYFLEG